MPKKPHGGRKGGGYASAFKLADQYRPKTGEVYESEPVELQAARTSTAFSGFYFGQVPKDIVGSYHAESCANRHHEQHNINTLKQYHMKKHGGSRDRSRTG